VRVVVVSAWEPWRTTDGAAFVLDHQLEVLAGRHEIRLLAAGAPHAQASPPPSLDTRWPPGIDRQWFGAGSSAGLDYVGRRLWSVRHREPAHVKFVERPGLVAALAQAVRDGADVVHLHGWGTAGLWDRVSPVPTVHVAIDPWSINVANRRTSRWRSALEVGQRRLIAEHERRHYPHLDRVVVLTERDAEHLRSIAPDARVAVVANGVDVGPDPAPIGDRPVLGFHGVFDSQANVDAARSLVTDLLPIVRRTVPEAQVLIVGRRPPRDVRSLAGQGIDVRADVADVRAELEKVAVHVDWMTSGAGIKNKVLEAMAAGRPVVTSALGAEGIGEGPGVLVADSAQAAAETIVALLRDLPAARETGRAARERVIEDFSWVTNAERIEALWSQVAG
jgi:glycosyltransferase involved in cell wall biosynthesis